MAGRSRPQEWAVRHHLEDIDLRVQMLDGDPLAITWVARSSSKRTALWVHEEVRQPGESTEGFLGRHAELLHTVVACQPMSGSQFDDVLSTGSLTDLRAQLPF